MFYTGGGQGISRMCWLVVRAVSKWKLITPLEQLIAKVRPSIFTLDSKDYLEIPEVSYIEHMVQLTKEMNEVFKAQHNAIS